ncbi:MAG: DUF6484 domain-containing protein [Candidatus Thiodiazotropha sp.]
MSSRNTLVIDKDPMSPSMQNLLRKEMKRPSPDRRAPSSTAFVGCLDGFDKEGYPIVVFTHKGREYRKSARSTLKLTQAQVGLECLIQLCGDTDTPVISGLIQPPLTDANNETTAIIRSDDQIRLQCGDAYIELTIDGSVRIRGDYVESVAYGANRLKGSSVKIN